MAKSTRQFVRTTRHIVAALAATAGLAASQSLIGPVTAEANVKQSSAVSVPQSAPANEGPKGPERIANYVLGPEDQIIIRAFQAEELTEKPIQIAGDGYISLAFVGRVKAAGLSVSELESDLTERLKLYLKNPQVSVFVAEYHSQPVSVVGDVTNPGVFQLRGRKTLIEVIALAGGLKADAGNTATITREISKGRLPLPGAADDANGRFNIARVNLHNVMDGRDPNNNLVIEANDVVMIPKARLLYVVGEVQKPGGYVLSEKDSVTVLQAVALAGGLTSQAAPKKAKILYQHSGETNRTEIATNVRKILDGKAPDVDLHAEDILFVPGNLSKSFSDKAITTAMNMAGIAVWRF